VCRSQFYCRPRGIKSIYKDFFVVLAGFIVLAIFKLFKERKRQNPVFVACHKHVVEFEPLGSMNRKDLDRFRLHLQRRVFLGHSGNCVQADRLLPVDNR